jgi:hypothetical protein
MALNINFTRPVGTDSGILSCEGRSIHLGRRTATAEGRLTDARGRLCAHGTATCAVRSMETPMRGRESSTQIQPGGYGDTSAKDAAP